MLWAQEGDRTITRRTGGQMEVKHNDSRPSASKTGPYLCFALASAHVEGATTINLDSFILCVRYLSRLCILA